MRKLFLLSLMLMFSFVLSAQTEHMKFAGIPLNGSIEQFQKKLVAKGFRLNTKMSKMLPVGTRSFVGTFAGKKGNIRKFKIELQFSVSDIDLNNLYLKTPRG